MKKLYLYLESIDKRSKITFFLSLNIFLIISLIFFLLMPLNSSNRKLEQKLMNKQKELQEMKMIGTELKGKLHSAGTVSLNSLDNLVRGLGMQDKVGYIKPLPSDDKGGIEISVENVKGNDITRLVSAFYVQKISVGSIQAVNLRGDDNFNVKVTIY